MKGSNLIIGVASKSVILKGTLVPATFFRTLAHIFELAKSGASYKAITADDIKRGSAQSDFTLQTLPLWLLESRKQSLVGGQHLQEETTATKSRDEEECPADRPARSRSPDTAGSSQPNDQPSSRPSSSSGKITTFRDNLDETTISGRLRDADALFSSAPFWCYLYSHEKQQAKKTPPKTGKEMLHLYQQGSVASLMPTF